MKKTRFTEPQIMAVLREAESGVAVPAVCRTHGISTASFYKWRAKYGGMDASMMSQMKVMEEENRRLKRMFADLILAQRTILRHAINRLARRLRPSQLLCARHHPRTGLPSPAKALSE